MKNNKGHTLFITVFILMILSILVLGTVILISNNTKVTNNRVNYVYKEIIVTNSLFDVLNDLVEKEEIELKEYKYNNCIVYIMDYNNDTYYIELYENETKLLTTVKFDLENHEYDLITLEVSEDV